MTLRAAARFAHPALGPVRGLLEEAFADGWPTPASWSRLAAARGVVNANGLPVRFVAPAHPSPSALDFERRMFDSGCVETRPNWHDAFHACTWLAFPLTKARINALHVADGAHASANRRSDLRNVLTLFDEGGMVVAHADPGLAQALRDFAWRRLFVERRAEVARAMDFVVIGHALYERTLALHHGSTARAVPVEVGPAYFDADTAARVRWLDAHLAALVGTPGFPARGRDLQPVPVKGIPGWADENEDPAYYDDLTQFRTGRREGVPC